MPIKTKKVQVVKKTSAMSRPVAKDVDEYIRSAPAEARPFLQKLRELITHLAPGATELISYQIPTYKFRKPIVAFAAFKNHYSLFTISRPVIATFEKELKDYHTSGVTLQFTYDKPFPAALLKKIIKARVKELEQT